MLIEKLDNGGNRKVGFCIDVLNDILNGVVHLAVQKVVFKELEEVLATKAGNEIVQKPHEYVGLICGEVDTASGMTKRRRVFVQRRVSDKLARIHNRKRLGGKSLGEHREKIGHNRADGGNIEVKIK